MVVITKWFFQLLTIIVQTQASTFSSYLRGQRRTRAPSEFTDSRIHGFADVWHIGAREMSEVLRGFAEVCGGLRDQRHSNQAQSSRLKIILESLNLRIPQNVEGTESARAKGKEKTESERREREVVRARGWREE